MAVAIRLVLACWLMCACVHILAGNSINCSMKANVEPRKGKRLPISIIANVTAETIQRCASICFRRSACRSFNYHQNDSEHLCQLNEFDHENNTIDDPNYVYSSINDWNPMMVYSCANHSCSEDYICLATSSRNYTCLQLDIQCGSPRSVEYTNEIQWPYARQYKSEIKYTCKPGYKYLSGNPKSVCQLNMTWSEPSMKCSKTSCGTPLNSRTAKVIFFNGSSVGDTAEYSCIKDTILKSKKNISVCKSDGSWSKPAECGFCRNSKNFTYYNRQVCYERSRFKTAHVGIPKNILIASEQSVVNLFQELSKSRKENVYAGFEVNRTHIRFANMTVIDRSVKLFNFGDCHKGVCIYDTNGKLTTMPSSTRDAFYYIKSDPK